MMSACCLVCHRARRTLDRSTGSPQRGLVRNARQQLKDFPRSYASGRTLRTLYLPGRRRGGYWRCFRRAQFISAAVASKLEPDSEEQQCDWKGGDKAVET